MSLSLHAGFRPRRTRFFCFGKRTQNQWHPGVAPRGFLCHGPCYLGCGTRCAQTVLAAIWHGRDRGAAPPAGAKTTAFVSSVMPGSIGHPGFFLQNKKGKAKPWILACARMTEKKHKDDREKRRDDGEKRKDDRPFCHARLDRASRVLGLHAGFRPRRRKERKGGHPGPPLHTDTMSL